MDRVHAVRVSPHQPVTAPALSPSDDSTYWRQALGILLASTLVRLAIGAAVPLFPDEAYYWEWSRRLAFGYFDHPPVIAALIAGGTALLGDTALGVRLFPILVGSAAGVAVSATARHLTDGRAARYVALLFAVMPLSAAGLVLATPDAPLLAAIAVTLYLVVRALDPTAVRIDSTLYWIGAGVAIGIAMASKFTGVFIPMAITLALIIHPGLRHHLRSPGPWLAVAVASLVMAPVLFWNAHHDWIAFRFQLGHGLGTAARGTWWQRELDLLGGQVGLLTPILFVLLVGVIIRTYAPRGEPTRFALAQVAVFCLGFFVYSATRKSVEANWPAIAWVPALALLAGSRIGARSTWERRAAWLAAALTTIALVHVVRPYLPLPAPRDPVSKAHGWAELAAGVHAVGIEEARSGATRGAVPAPSDATRAPTVHVAANRYQDAALLAFHLPEHPDVYALNIGARRNQYDLWTRITTVAQQGDIVLLVLDERGDPPANLPPMLATLAPHFAETRMGPLLPLVRGQEDVGRRRVWILADWRGSWPVDPSDPLSPR
jgi:hypothetical protein